MDASVSVSHNMSIWERSPDLVGNKENPEFGGVEPPRKRRRKYIAKAWYVLLRFFQVIPSELIEGSNECKRRKIKCNGEKPCVRCGRQRIGCVYDNPHDDEYGSG
jgi:hypothetical protein